MDLRPEVIHAHDFYGLMVKGMPVPRVFTIHGFIYGDTLVSGQRLAWLRSKLWERVEKAGWGGSASHHLDQPIRAGAPCGDCHGDHPRHR